MNQSEIDFSKNSVPNSVQNPTNSDVNKLNSINESKEEKKKKNSESFDKEKANFFSKYEVKEKIFFDPPNKDKLGAGGFGFVILSETELPNTYIKHYKGENKGRILVALKFNLIFTNSTSTTTTNNNDDAEKTIQEKKQKEMKKFVQSNNEKYVTDNSCHKNIIKTFFTIDEKDEKTNQLSYRVNVSIQIKQ